MLFEIFNLASLASREVKPHILTEKHKIFKQCISIKSLPTFWSTITKKIK